MTTTRRPASGPPACKSFRVSHSVGERVAAGDAGLRAERIEHGVAAGQGAGVAARGAASRLGAAAT